MAKMMFKNLGAIVSNTLTDSIKMIDIDELHNSDDNFFDINRVEEFAETILGQGGVKDNLVVRPLDDGGYEIISGHRRKAAVQYLLDNGEEISRYLPCLVQNYDDNDDKILDIVLLNVSSRQISDSEMWKSYEVVDKILQSKKSAGEKFGRVRDKLAECLGISLAQVAKIKNVDNNAIEPVKEAIENGNISIHTANEIAKLDEDEQKKIVQSGLDNIKPKNIPKKKSLEENATNSTFSEDDTFEPNEEIVTDNNFAKNNIEELDEESEENATSSTFSEDDTSKPNEEIVTDNNFSENDIEEPDEKSEENTTAELNESTDEPTKETTLADFIHEHYFDIESIFTAYISMTDNSDEVELLEEFQKLLYQTKEAERNKARFRP